ncbi:MAG TPA: PQQ-binding-like beta-propeller repeat protein [Humisphaera sp.]
MTPTRNTRRAERTHCASTRRAVAWVAAAAAAVCSIGLAARADFKDPAPPVAAALPAAPAPAAQPNPDATVHGRPKPLPAGAVTSDWVAFLGPNHNLVSPETKLAAAWPAAGPRAVWEAKKGQGYAAPAVVGDRLILFHRLGDNDTIDCLHRETGARFWRAGHPTAYHDRYGYSDGPRASPVVAADAGLVFVQTNEGKLICLELATGRQAWARDLKKEFKLKPGFFGLGATPLVEGGKLIVNVGAEPDGPCVAAFDLATGKMLWGAGKHWGMSYASPVAATVHGKRRVFVFAGGETDPGEPVTGGLLCIDPETGNVDFTEAWRGDRRESVNASAPLVIGNRVLVSECYGAGGLMLEVTPDFKAKRVWSNEKFGTHFMVALHQGSGGGDGYLYGVDGHGPADADLVCVDAATGKEQWRTQPEWKEKVGERNLTMGTYRAHLLAADGQVLMLGEFGHLLRVGLSPKGVEVKQRAWLFGASETWTPPVLSRGLLYVCQNNPDRVGKAEPRVICYDLRGE